MTVHIVALDDHPIVVQGIMALVSAHADEFELVATATDWPQLRVLLQQIPRPDIALVDLHLEHTDAYDAVAELSAAGITVMMLTSELKAVPIRRAMAAGASGLALKSDSPADITSALRELIANGEAVSSTLAFTLVSDEALIAHLPPREVEVLELLADGVPRKSVGSRLSPPVALSTVNTYINRACMRYRELGRQVWTPRDVIRAAMDDGYIDTTYRSQAPDRP